MNRNLRGINRFGLGARIGEADRVGDAREWLRDQLAGAPTPLAAEPPMSASQLGDALRAQRPGPSATPEERMAARRRLASISQAEERAILLTRVTTERPYVERLIAFWSNHLAISTAGKPLVAPLAGSYDRDVIRRHVLGRFEDMLLASAKHPAMLIYLDNFQSIGPGSPAVRRRPRAGVGRGLNENYARELLELHTLGVDGGYSQNDVQELARILTGWTISGLPGAGRGLVPGGGVAAGGPIEFAFEAALHEPGEKVLLGRRLRESGVAEGEQAIRLLARHPSTAKFIATKLVRHFVSDDPPASAVDEIARVFGESGGDLRAVSLALIDLEDAWSAEARKFRPPQEWIVAAIRALGAPQLHAGAAGFLRQLRQPLWSPPSPAGYGDRLRDWADPDALLNRAELARTITGRTGRRGPEPGSLLQTVDVETDDPLRRVLDNVSIPPAERVALAIAGPAFQWR